MVKQICPQKSETESAAISFQIRSLVLGSQVFHFHFHVSEKTERLRCFFVDQDLELLALTIGNSESAVKLSMDLEVFTLLLDKKDEESMLSLSVVSSIGL